MDVAVKQLRDVQDAIKVNIDSIKKLLDQADMLNNTINEVTDAQIKKKLESNVDSLYATIDTLVKNTDTLFEELVEYANASGNYKKIA